MKQEIAKEGVLPFSLFFATSSPTPYAWIKERIWPSSRQPGSERPAAEESPAAALLLHWFFSVFLIGCTAANDPSVAYTVLVALYSYTLVIVVGFLVAAGLLYLKLSRREEWNANAGFSPWGGPTAAIIYWLVLIPVDSFYPQQRRLTLSYQPHLRFCHHRSLSPPECRIAVRVRNNARSLVHCAHRRFKHTGAGLHLLLWLCRRVASIEAPGSRRRTRTRDREAIRSTGWGMGAGDGNGGVLVGRARSTSTGG